MPDRADPLAALLGDAAVWSEPDATLADEIVAAVVAERPAGASRPRRASVVRRWIAPVAVGVAAAIVVLIAGSAIDDDDDGRRPGGVEVALAASELAPGASAVATVTDTPLGTRIDLDVSRLAPAGVDEYYELWLWDGDGDAVSAGSFHLRGGAGAIELWAGVGLDDYPRMTVTRQREGAGTSPSGEVVLRSG
jgi:hypothetical protein